MTEAGWLECNSLSQLLKYIPYAVSKRKWRLLAVAFCRRIWHLLADERSKQAVEAAEQWADGLISMKELKRAQEAATPFRLGLVGERIQEAPGAAYSAAIPRKDAVDSSAHSARMAVHYAGGSIVDEEKRQCDISRDILGYPYRAVQLDPSWLTWNCGTIHRIAEAIYDARAFKHMPILADALEDAGCDDADILNHCRQSGEHVRGCWVVDLLLNKK